MSENPSAPTWWNFSGNVEHLPPTDGENYYFTPNNLADLQSILTQAQQNKVTVRVSGQRHSQPPLVTNDNRTSPPPKPDGYLVDMSCYIDIPPNGITTGPGPNQITVNPGVREDDVDAFLQANNLMFKTVTAGGFFSIGGMTAVDVHGATIAETIFAETASSFTILQADGQLHTIDTSTAAANGWSPIQFARVSLGGLGIVTQIVLNVQPRPYANTLQGGQEFFTAADRQSFINGFPKFLTNDRLEVFFNPYAPSWLPNFLALKWNTVANPNPPIPNTPLTPATACALAQQGEFGAPKITIGESIVRATQYTSTADAAALVVATAMTNIIVQASTANSKYSELWLSEAAQVMFMSYWIELPNLDADGLGKVWDGLQAVATRTTQNGVFHIVAPMEFRFVHAGNTAMSGTYSTNPNATFLNLDLIGFIEPTTSAQYPAALLQFFADVERDWVAMGGFPHNGKMYGFYDPTAAPGTYTAAFNPNFLADLRTRRGARLQAFKSYLQSQDPNGLFYNAFLKELLG